MTEEIKLTFGEDTPEIEIVQPHYYIINREQVDKATDKEMLVFLRDFIKVAEFTFSTIAYDEFSEVSKKIIMRMG